MRFENPWENIPVNYKPIYSDAFCILIESKGYQEEKGKIYVSGLSFNMI